MKKIFLIIMGAAAGIILFTGNASAFSYVGMKCDILNNAQELAWVQEFESTAQRVTKYEDDSDLLGDDLLFIEGDDLFIITPNTDPGSSGTVEFRAGTPTDRVWWMVVKADGGQKIYKYDPTNPGNSPYSWNTSGICDNTDNPYDVSTLLSIQHPFPSRRLRGSWVQGYWGLWEFG